MRKESNVSLDKNLGSHIAKKFTCPSCNQKKKYVRYFDKDQSDYLPFEFGRCDREEHCGYFVQPWEWLKDQSKSSAPTFQKRTRTAQPAKKLEFVDRQIVSRTLQHFDANNFVVFLRTIMSEAHVQKILSTYFVGTARDGGTIFWQIDNRLRIRTGQRIIYDPATGRRDKNHPPKRLFMLHNGFEPCLFGEHLLFTEDKSLPVAIVESEKTAIICSAFLPFLNGKRVIWIACSGVNGLTDEKIKILKGRNVILVPDLSFHARATWGLVEMRKKNNDKGVLVPHPDGEIVPDFESTLERMEGIGINVTTFDADPLIDDSSDIADLLIATAKPPTLFSEPDFDSLVVREGKNDDPCDSLPVNSPDKGSGNIIASLGPKSFKLTANPEGVFFAHCEDRSKESYINDLVNKNPCVNELVKFFDICVGAIEPIGYGFE